MLYGVLGMEDSARNYYEKGLSYADEKEVRSRNYYLLLQNYATFLKEGGEYAEAERLLYECATGMTDTTYVYTLYSSLASLHPIMTGDNASSQTGTSSVPRLIRVQRLYFKIFIVHLP